MNFKHFFSAGITMHVSVTHNRRRAKEFGGTMNLPECSKWNISKNA